ncbi:hypothetical protein [Acidovorax sp. Root219]|uniref:hypothetical protein n=1 Tax=Acidovorax sp. Root219 TaxID=1736493 RepID=UPI00070A459C|nr:hypothetical protein [Acidovorax sp. Root219]KRC36238.1 hypothetical protein ASE28_01505 [Acidovorax sp. Root219]
MRILSAAIIAALTSAAAWAQLPDRGSWMAGGDDGGSGLPGGGFSWFVVGYFVVFAVLAYLVPRRFTQWVVGVAVAIPFLYWGSVWAMAALQR